MRVVEGLLARVGDGLEAERDAEVLELAQRVVRHAVHGVASRVGDERLHHLRVDVLDVVEIDLEEEQARLDGHLVQERGVELRHLEELVGQQGRALERERYLAHAPLRPLSAHEVCDLVCELPWLLGVPVLRHLVLGRLLNAHHGPRSLTKVRAHNQGRNLLALGW